MSIFKRKRGKHAAQAEPAVEPDLTTEPEEAQATVPGQLAMRYGHRHLIVTPAGTWAYYVVDDVDWQNQTPDERGRIMSAWSHRIASLTGHRMWIRLTTSPVNYRAWAERLDRDYPHRDADLEPGRRPIARRLHDVTGEHSFHQLLEDGMNHMVRLDARRTAVIIGVRLTEEQIKARDLPSLLSPKELGEAQGVLEGYRRTLRQVTKVVSDTGMSAKPITAKALGWLVHASLGMGAPVPPVLLHGSRQGWVEDEIPGFTGSVYASHAPHAATTTVRALRGGEQVTAHVAVLALEKFEPRNLDDAGLVPFLAWAATLPYEVEVVAQLDVIPGRDLRRDATRSLNLGKNIAEHNDEHGDEPPAEVLRGIIRAREYADEVTNGDRAVSTRARGVIQFAVTGYTEEDAIENARDLTARAAEEQGITLHHPYGQFARYRAFTPGEPMPMEGFVTQMPSYFLAAGVPNASTRGGDGTGWIVGNIGGGHDVMLFDLQGGSRRNLPNLHAIGAAPGHGKSTVGGALLAWEARMGVQSVGYDPAGQWKRLCDLPYLRNDARHLDLFTAKPGTLNPGILIVEPRETDFDTTEDYAAAVREAHQERQELMIDSLRDLLPYAMVTESGAGAVIGVIEDSVTEVAARDSYGMNPWDIVDRMQGMGETGRMVAQRLIARSELKDGSLIFPRRGGDVDDAEVTRLLDQATLTIVTLTGLTLPPQDSTSRALWTRQQQQSVPILNLGSRFATRVMYGSKDPKAIEMDEVGISAGAAGSSFAPFMNRASVDSRKWNTHVGLYFQNPSMLTSIDAEIGNLVGSAWIGRMSAKVAPAALDLLGLDEGYGYERIIANLEPGEFMVRDWEGRVRKVRVDRSWWEPQLLSALDTNPLGEGTYDLRLTADEELFGAGGAA